MVLLEVVRRRSILVIYQNHCALTFKIEEMRRTKIIFKNFLLPLPRVGAQEPRKGRQQKVSGGCRVQSQDTTLPGSGSEHVCFSTLNNISIVL